MKFQLLTITIDAMQHEGNPGKRYDTWNDVHMVLFHTSVLIKEYVFCKCHFTEPDWTLYVECTYVTLSWY